MNTKRLFAIMAIAAVAVIAVVAGCNSASSSGSGAAGAGGVSGAGGASGAATFKQVSQEEAQQLMKTESGYIIVDVRRQNEFDTGHIPGAICIPNESINGTRPAELPDLDQLILVYCRSGRRSKQAAEKLANMGYTNVVEFGGINTWPGEVVTD